MNTRPNIFSVSLWALNSFHPHRPFTGWPKLVLLTPFPLLIPPSPLLSPPSPLLSPLWLLQLPCCSLEQMNFLLPGDLCSPCPTCWSSEDPPDFITSEKLPPLQKTLELSGTPNYSTLVFDTFFMWTGFVHLFNGYLLQEYISFVGESVSHNHMIIPTEPQHICDNCSVRWERLCWTKY